MRSLTRRTRASARGVRRRTRKRVGGARSRQKGKAVWSGVRGGFQRSRPGGRRRALGGVAGARGLALSPVQGEAAPQDAHLGQAPALRDGAVRAVPWRRLKDFAKEVARLQKSLGRFTTATSASRPSARVVEARGRREDDARKVARRGPPVGVRRLPRGCSTTSSSGAACTSARRSPAGAWGREDSSRGCGVRRRAADARRQDEDEVGLTHDSFGH